MIDNILPSLASQFIKVIKASGEFTKMAMVMDARAKSFYTQILPCLAKLRALPDLNVKVLFLDADDVKLVSRYKETRRAHPLAEHDGVLAGIQRERQLMAELVSEADVKIDTTALTPAQAQFADCRVFWGREWADAVLRPGGIVWVQVWPALGRRYCYGRPLFTQPVLFAGVKAFNR